MSRDTAASYRRALAAERRARDLGVTLSPPDTTESQLEAALAVLAIYDKAADRFEAKCRAGQARSVETREWLRRGRRASKELRGSIKR